MTDRENRKLYAQFFTDPEIVNLMLNEVGYTSGRLKNYKTQIRIIDPACGSGNFLCSAVERIVNAFDDKTHSRENMQRIGHAVSSNVYGYDIDPSMVKASIDNIRKLPVFPDSTEPLKLNVFHTEDSIAEFVKHSRICLGYFDYVVMNPPYIGYNECCKRKMAFTQIKNNPEFSMANVYGVNLNTANGKKKPYSPKPNLFAYFIALGLALLKESGRMAFICPQTILTLTDLDTLRFHLYSHTVIEKIIIFNENMFFTGDDPVKTSSIIFIIRKSPPCNVPFSGQEVEVVNHTSGVCNSTESYVCKKVLAGYENWNFLKWTEEETERIRAYVEKTVSIDEYRKSVGYDTVQFDKGVVYDKSLVNSGNRDFLLVGKSQPKDSFDLNVSDDFIDVNNLYFPKGSQGIGIFQNRYKIVWRYMNPERFYFSDRNVIVNFNWCIISSNSRQEILFLLSILNSKETAFILSKYLENANEKAVLCGISAIKKYVRVPETHHMA
jgi:type I restriction-modification system DNA methylase subunit